MSSVDNSLKQSGLWPLFLCVACIVLWVFMALIHHEVYTRTNINSKLNLAKYFKCLNSTEQIFSDIILTQNFSMFDSKWIFSVTVFIFGYLLNQTNQFLWSYAGKEFGLFSFKHIAPEKTSHVMPTGCILSWVVSVVYLQLFSSRLKYIHGTTASQEVEKKYFPFSCSHLETQILWMAL